MALRYVGSATASGTGATYNIDLTSLTGGIGSAPIEGDIVIVTTGIASTSDIDMAVSGYTELADLYSNDVRDSNLFVGYKLMTSTPDTSITVPGSGDAAQGGASAAVVWRGVDQSTPIDATTTTQTSIDTPRFDPASITTVTPGAVIMACGMGTGDSTPLALTPPSAVEHPVTTEGAGTTMSTLIGVWARYVNQGASTQNIAASGSGETSLSDSYAVATVALRPATSPPYWKATGTAVSATTGTLTVAWPTHAVDDIGLLFVESQANETVLSTPEGFTQVGSNQVATGTSLQVYWCRATSTTMASPIKAADSDHQYGVIVTFGGCVSTGDPFTTSAGAVKDVASTTSTAPAVTTVNDVELIVIGITKDLDATAGFASAPTNANVFSIVERHDAGTTSGDGGGIAVQVGIATTAQDIGTTDITVTSSTSAMMTIALTANAVGGSSSIKKLSGVAQASVKKVSGVAEASVKKISGVAN